MISYSILKSFVCMKYFQQCKMFIFISFTINLSVGSYFRISESFPVGLRSSIAISLPTVASTMLIKQIQLRVRHYKHIDTSYHTIFLFLNQNIQLSEIIPVHKLLQIFILISKILLKVKQLLHIEALTSTLNF